MERRNFFKKMIGVIAGLVIVPFVIEAKETTGDVNKPIFNVTMRNNNELRSWENPKDHRMVLFTAEGEAYESKDIILTK